jgi:hypothetical protein
MIHAHNVFKEGYDNLVKLIDQPQRFEGDLKNFLGYSIAWAEAIVDHHDAEEVTVFPILKEKINIDTEVAQHEALHKALDDFIAFLKAAEADASKFDAAQFKTALVGLREPLYTHLDEEVEDIAPEKLKVFDESTVKSLNVKLEQHAKANGNPFVVVPFMMSHTPENVKPHWPSGMPWILRKVLIPYVFAKKHSGYWKYSPYPTA